MVHLFCCPELRNSCPTRRVRGKTSLDTFLLSLSGNNIPAPTPSDPISLSGCPARPGLAGTSPANGVDTG